MKLRQNDSDSSSFAFMVIASSFFLVSLKIEKFDIQILNRWEFDLWLS